MLGYIGKGHKGKQPQFTVVPGDNPRRVNLLPFDVVTPVEKSARFPDGLKRTPAASQEDFKLILKHIPERKNEIVELTPEQEREYRTALSQGCLWYQEQEKKEKEKTTSIFSKQEAKS